MTITIDRPDHQATALQAKALAAGITMQALIAQLAEQEAQTFRKTRRYNLAELMEQCDLEAPLSDEDREWLDAPAVGREAL